MAGVAGDFPFIVKHSGIERHGHRYHAPSDVFLSFVINVELSKRVTVRAADPKREGDVFHRGVNFSSGNILEYFYLLIELRRGLAFHIFGCGRGSGRSRRRWSLRV